jgi:hypothetical protein
MEQTNVHEHQQIFSPERASTPTNWDDKIAMDEFDLSLSYQNYVKDAQAFYWLNPLSKSLAQL